MYWRDAMSLPVGIAPGGSSRTIVIDRQRRVVMLPTVARDLRIRCGKSSRAASSPDLRQYTTGDRPRLIVDQSPAANLCRRRGAAAVYSSVITQSLPTSSRRPRSSGCLRLDKQYSPQYKLARSDSSSILYCTRHAIPCNVNHALILAQTEQLALHETFISGR